MTNLGIMDISIMFLALSGIVTLAFLVLSYRVDRKLLLVGNRPSEFPKVSVIIPAHNKAELIERCIDSVKASSYPNKEILAINDCSSDNTGEILGRIAGIKVLKNKKRLGKAASLNKAAKICSGSLMLFLDADTIIDSRSISKLVFSYNSYKKSGENIGLIAPKYTLINKRSFLAKMVYIEQAIHQFLIKVQMNFGSILSIRGCCLLVDKKAFNSAGGFSNHILEDGDFCAKVAKAGYKIKYEPRAAVETGEPETFKDFFRSRKRYGKGSIFCLIDHRRHFLFSRQALLTFYPYFILSLVFLGVYTSVLFSFNLFFLVSLASALGLVGLSSSIGMFICGSVTAKGTLENFSIAALFLPYIFIYIPLASIGYARGALSGVNDRIKERGKLKLKEW